MNSFGKIVQSSRVYLNSVAVNSSFPASSNNSSKFLSTLNLSRKNERIASLSVVHKSCFNTSNVEQKFLEEVGYGQADPALNPSPS
ncbi:hypothetical protein DICPUDRAFT_46562 [Dictyostelium purpureum]|uniref:Uncharacterized protein n=1 Tax=Dictyostelium purpureum TaxID=5786 RepID=F0ZFB8_DICPU|nr:uncharacterized protein DICPUDRAFT_46562 [Dictyostelium purpureum]EGC37380.1 hypothetical protein DICPUDRAFT_46562 [Dictyostelium purpureum]|eukprot:XP_003286121.1 hypothetical protein DICPUDRAFT_46562 [Dictyostelium purpureum]